MLRVSTLDVWTPCCSNPRLQEWVNDLTSSLGKNMTLFGLEKVPTNLHQQHIHRLTCQCIVPWSRRIRGRVKKAWPQISFTCLPSRSNEPLPSSGICIVKRLRLLKPYLTYCLAAAPSYFPLQKKPTRCYVKRQWRVCLVCDPTNMQFFLVQKARVRHCFLHGVWSFPYQDTLGRHGHHRTRMEWKTSELRHTLHPTGERNVEMSCLLLSCGQYLTVTEQSVLYVVKKKERIYCPNKSKTEHLWEMCKVTTVKQENWWGREPLAMLLE